MKHSTLPQNLANTTLVVPGCSASLVDNFAIDWIIESLGLQSVAVFDSENVTPMVQQGVFGESKITSAMELYSAPDSTVSVLQIRSSVVSHEGLAKELVELGQQFARIVVIGAASAFMLSGKGLEETSRFRVLGAAQDGWASIELADVHQGGILKRLVSAESKVPLSCYLVLTSGQGYVETRFLSEELAAKTVDVLGLKLDRLLTPKSVLTLERPPVMTPELERIL